MEIFELSFVYCLGALGYGGLEMLWRGRTHWTMLLLGGLSFLLIYLIVTRLQLPLWKKWLLSAVSVTVLEFFCGCLVNLRMGWNVWDYSALPGNLLGQICPQFFALWLLLCIPCSGLARLIRRFIFSASAQG